MKIDEIAKLIKTINDTKAEIEKQYGEKIKEINTKIEELQSNSKGRSKQYVKDQKSKLQIELDEIIEAQKVKLTQFGEELTNKLANTQAKAVYDIAKNTAARLGIKLPDLPDSKL